jgi:hypothetical protein
MRLLLVVAFLLPIGALAQEGAKKGPPPEPKNLKVLKGMPREQLIPVMRTFTASLGVKCDYCHVQGDFASDENPKKDIARNMIVMSQHIGTHFPEDGKHHVTCYTCHRGTTEPLVAPPPAAGAK